MMSGGTIPDALPFAALSACEKMITRRKEILARLAGRQPFVWSMLPLSSAYSRITPIVLNTCLVLHAMGTPLSG